MVGEMHSCGGELRVHEALGQQSKLTIVIEWKICRLGSVLVTRDVTALE